MRRLLIVLSLGVALLLSACTSTSSAVSTVSPTEFITAMSEPDTVVIDVRTPGEYAAGHVDGALNIDVDSPDFAAQMGALPTDGTYAVYCRSGRRSTIATDRMAEQGFTSVLNLDGGVADLQAAGAPIVAG